ncbi:MAG: outer membrane protein assembly factor BamB family protein [Sulfuricaulis sp.]
MPAGFNSVASVTVQVGPSGAPITNASVSVNGVPLAYSSANQDYEGGLSVNPTDSVSLSVTVGSTTYTASGTQFTSYPTITNPVTGTSWSSLASNLAAWSGVAPTTSSVYALGVMDTNGQLIWPSGNSIQILPSTTTSYTIPSSSLTAGSRYVIVGLNDVVSIPDADPNSGFVIGGYNYAPITVIVGPIATLSSIAVTPSNPTVTDGKTLQLTATGTYSDGSTQDLTSQVSWQSSDPTKVTVSATGQITGKNNYGSATVTATSGSVPGSTLVNVFQLNPSPTPPLSQAVAYQIDYAHSGNAVFSGSITSPSNPTWSVTLNGAISYPLIAGGMVYVTTANPGPSGGTYGTSLYALNEQNGAVVWGPVSIAGTYNWSATAFDHDKIFVINFDGVLRSFDAATGTAGWSTALPGAYGFSAPPTAVNGIVYALSGTPSSGALYAVDESSGNVLWTTYVTAESSPTLSSDGVFVTSGGCQVYKVDPITAAILWRYVGSCSTGGQRTPAFGNGKLYIREPIFAPPNTQPVGEIFDATSGTLVGSFSAKPIPAIGASTAFFLNGGTLQAIDLASSQLLWNFSGDGQLVSAPILINNQIAIVGSGTGNVYLLNAMNGAVLWSGSAGAAISAPDEDYVGQPLTGLGAGEGYLVVPAGNILTAWKLSGP